MTVTPPRQLTGVLYDTPCAFRDRGELEREGSYSILEYMGHEDTQLVIMMALDYVGTPL